jgi:pimeloyl-ACP methyl ester carboxylesterase
MSDTKEHYPMRKLRGLIVACLMVVSCIHAQSPAGHFEGAVTRDGSVQLMQVDLDTSGGVIAGSLDIPELMDFEVPIPPATWRNDTLILWLNYSNFDCRYFPATDEITGVSETWLPRIRVHLKKGGRKGGGFQRKEISFENKNVHLAGILFSPSGGQSRPWVVLIHGSGESDRKSAYYHSLGYALAERGIGVLLYDKRGCGKSSGDWMTASMQDLADDAVAALEFLEDNERGRISKAGFLGTSQGGWITAIAANRAEKCDFAVLNVGPSVSVYHQEMDRVRYSMKSDGLSQSAVDSAVWYTSLYFRYVASDAKNDREALDEYADQIRGREWARYVDLTVNSDDLVWWRNNDYDPATDLSRIRCPVLSIFGSLDVLVPPAENAARMDSLLHLSGMRHTVQIIPNVGHDELTFQGLNGDQWSWPNVYWQWRKRPEAIVNGIADWIKQR